MSESRWGINEGCVFFKLQEGENSDYQSRVRGIKPRLSVMRVWGAGMQADRDERHGW